MVLSEFLVLLLFHCARVERFHISAHITLRSAYGQSPDTHTHTHTRARRGRTASLCQETVPQKVTRTGCEMAEGESVSRECFNFFSIK